jgi:hypothetical protein
MKSSVIIALIVCGTVLVAIPYIHNTVAVAQLTDTMVALSKPVNLTADLPKYADVACMLGGFIMIMAGAIAGLRSEKSD